MNKLSFVQNTIVLVISNLITGILGLLFSIILSKEVGAHGVGLYSMVMPVYSFFICISCGGTTTALSKIVAERNSQGNIKELYKSITVSIAFFAFWTALTSIAAVLLAPYISTYMLKDQRTYLPILAFIPALIFLSIGSVLKGYFYGLQNSTFPAVIDILEKCIRIIVLIVLTEKFKIYGLKYQVAGAVLAMTAGELSSTLLLYTFYKKSYLDVKSFQGKADNTLQIIANVLLISLPLCLNGLLSTVSGTAIAAMVPRRLQNAGFAPETSLALFGRVAGMGLNIIMFPSIIISAISTILVPVISEASSSKSMSGINNRIYSTIKVTSIIASISCGLFFAMPNEIGMLFYRRADLGNILFSLSFGVMFVYIESTLFGILNGLGKQRVLLRNTVIMSSIDIAVLYIFLGIPKINIYGYAFDFVISSLAGCVLNYIEIYKITGIRINLYEIFILPLIITVCNVYVINVIKPVICNIFKQNALNYAFLIIIGISFYLFLYSVINKYFKKRS